MATKEQIEKIHAEMEKAQPVDLFKNINKTQAGIGAVLRMLYDSNGTVTAGQISEVLGVSTARVAVLLKKMAAKGLITKAHDCNDARVTIVRLTEKGGDIVVQMRDDLFTQIGNIIDTIGEERLMEFIGISKEIKALIKAPPEVDF